MGAPKGNTNATRAKEWRDALKHAIDNYEGIEKGLALRKIGEKLVSMALDGDMQAIKEIGDRLDGKPVQAVEGTGEDGQLVVEIVRFASKDSE